MLEILIVYSLGRKIAAKAREKGRSGGPFVILLLVLWIGGELFGAIAAGVFSVIALGDEEPNLPICYAGALIGAAIGAFVAFLIVKATAHAHDENDYEEYDRRDAGRY